MSKRALFPLAVLLLLVAGCKKSDDGKLSDSEMKEAAQDLMQLAQGARAGDPTSVNVSYEPKTKFGKDFKALFVKSANIERKMTAVMESSNVEKIVSPQRLSSAQGIADSKADLKKLEVASDEYYDGIGKVAVEMIQLISKAAGKTPDNGSVILTETREIAAKSTVVWGATRTLIEVAEKGHPTLNGSTLTFKQDAEVKAYNDALAKLQKAVADQTDFITKTMQARQRRLSEGMSMLSSLN